jgi:hypothetical protein
LAIAAEPDGIGDAILRDRRDRACDVRRVRVERAQARGGPIQFLEQLANAAFEGGLSVRPRTSFR